MISFEDIYPTHVGMNRMRGLLFSTPTNLPHTCGDEPLSPVAKQMVDDLPHTCGDEPRKRYILLFDAPSTPHMWG